MGSRVLITGAAGFIGSHLTEYLLAQGYTVTGLDDLSTGSMDNPRTGMTPRVHPGPGHHSG